MRVMILELENLLKICKLIETTAINDSDCTMIDRFVLYICQ